MKKEFALENEILRGVVGSTAHGTAMADQDDRDEMGICIEPPDYVLGLRTFEQWIYRTQPEGVRSGPGDLDLIIYSLRKWCRLAVQGNPSVLLLLWLPEYVTQTKLGCELVELRSAFVSQEAGKRFLGYLVSQRRALMGERTKKVSRPDLVAAHGYDTKFAMHALRLAMQGIEYLTEGKITLPVPGEDLKLLRDVRAGVPTLEDVLDLIHDKESQLHVLADQSVWIADVKRINDFLIRAHRRHWRVMNA